MPNTSSPAEMQFPVAERRRSPRQRIDVRTRVSVTSSNGVTTVCQGTGTNLSDRGMAVHLPLELAIGKKLRVVVLLDIIQQQIRCEGTVRSGSGDQYGIEFTDLSSEHRDLILRCSREFHG
jgi:hypothetical protein